MKCPKCKREFSRGLGTHAAACGVSDEELFWSRVDKNGANGCWLWQGYCQKFGHGWLGRLGLAHRYAWTLLVGPLPADKCLLHKCDVPACVNPAHLYIGDRADNAHDAMSKLRHTHGEKNVHAKLSENDVRELRRLRKEGWTSTRLSEKFGISPNTCVNIWNRRIWKYVEDKV